MRSSLGSAALAVALGIAAPAAALADDAHKSICIASYQIDHTEIPDDNTIIFHMRDHKVWKNTLIDRCVGLKINSRGFTYSPTNPGTDEICSNLQMIRVNDTGQICLLGEFTPVEPAPPK